MAAEVVKKMGILAGPDSESSLETSDPSLYSARVAELLGTRHNGVWSTQAEFNIQKLSLNIIFHLSGVGEKYLLLYL